MLRIAHRCKAVMLASIATHWYFSAPRSLEPVFRMGFMEKCQPFILWSLEAHFWLRFADNGLGSVSTNNRNISMITTTNNPCMDVILETPFASRLCVCLNRISYYSSCAQPPQNLRTLPLHHSPTITCSTLDLPFNHLPNSSIPWTPTSPTMAAPGAAGARRLGLGGLSA